MALSDNPEARRRQLGYLFANGVFDNDYMFNLTYAFPELKEVIDEVYRNELIIDSSKYNMTIPSVARYYYRFVKIPQSGWSRDLYKKYEEERQCIFRNYNSLAYDKKIEFNLQYKLKELRVKYYELRHNGRSNMIKVTNRGAYEY